MLPTTDHKRLSPSLAVPVFATKLKAIKPCQPILRRKKRSDICLLSRVGVASPGARIEASWQTSIHGLPLREP
jgi:hypothetical protein